MPDEGTKKTKVSEVIDEYMDRLLENDAVLDKLAARLATHMEKRGGDGGTRKGGDEDDEDEELEKELEEE